MFDFNDLLNSIRKIDKEDFDKYIESIYIDFNSYITGLSSAELKNIKNDIEDMLYDLIEEDLISENNSAIVDSFLLLIAEQLEKLNFIGAIVEILQFLQESSTKQRLKASVLYLNVNNIREDYFTNFDEILSLIENSEEEYRYKAVNSVLNYYLTAISQFARVKNNVLANSFRELFIKNQSKFEILKDPLIVDVVTNTDADNYLDVIGKITTQIDKNSDFVTSCTLVRDDTLVIEKSEYSKKLYSLKEANFATIRQISFDYIKSIGNPDELHTRLNHGVTIIDDEQLLYKYMTSYGAMHKAKLYESFEAIIDRLNNTKINIIDWGCGQALATSLLIEYIKEKRLQTDIQSITLIEPSKLALSRGLLHVDVLKQKNYTVKAINKDLDCLEQSDLEFDNNNVVLHLFSNILDVESFKLDIPFLEKISQNIKNSNYFICVSPNINAKRNGRLDIFYKYFDDNFNTDLISTRDTDIGNYKRYEKVFEVKYIEQKDINQAREGIKNYYVDIYTKLEKYTSVIEPIFSADRLKEHIENDPDYVIFKIRKVTEIITSKIYMNNGGKDESRVSQNDKIRYLSFEKKILSRKAQSHLHTIRTIGNIGTHEHIENPAKMLKDDAYFLATALILLIEDLQENKII